MRQLIDRVNWSRIAATKQYVVGLLFHPDSLDMLLIEKRKGPPALIGKWNGIGGKIEKGETPHKTMVREFKEETNLNIQEWTEFLQLSGDGWKVYFFYAYSRELYSYMQMEEEKLETFNAHLFQFVGDPDSLAPNLRWIVPMALNHRKDHVEVYQVHEALTC